MELQNNVIRVKVVCFNSFVALWLCFIAVYQVKVRWICVIFIYMTECKLSEESTVWKANPSQAVNIANFLTDKFMDTVL